MPTSFLLRTGAVIIAALWLAGCVQTKTTPGYARAGDHIVIGLGGVERNAGGELALRADDLTVTLTDANSMQHVLEPRFVFKTYLDYAARMNLITFDGSDSVFGLQGMVPFDGGWYVVAPLTEYGVYSEPLPLAVGPATIAVSSNKLTNTADSFEGDLSAIPIEIIDGTSAQDVDFIKQFFGYIEDNHRFLISPDDLSGIPEVGGAYLVVNYSDDSFFQGGVEPMVVPANHNPFVQLNYNVISNGDGTGAIHIAILNPAGFTTLANAGQNSSLLSDLNVKLLYFADDATDAADAKAVFTLDTVESYYIDSSGDVLSGVSPTLTHAADL